MAERSRSVASRLFDLPLWCNSRAVLAYMSLPFEVDTRPIITAALIEKKQVFVPRVDGELLAFHAIDRLADVSVPHVYGMLEPPARLPCFPYGLHADASGLVLVPGLAFDPQKNRLGRGKGFYDRFLRSLEKEYGRERFPFVGICFQEQLLPAVPHGDRDVVMDGVLTDDKTIF